MSNAMHQGPLAAATNMSVCATVSPIPFRFLGTGAPLPETGFVVTSPHLIALANALETMPATFRTVLAERGRDTFVRRVAASFQQPPPLAVQMQ